eukprot:TRINITY_DN52846_c0_g1_i8.p1 TRINITY_DN52846_c0_g1~~TRINITY_DN52846_c0_g1_i8.p1  ORF type:complete len:149 (+),score=6.91 TRINITY_DN52846_c0_g1_i8:131-577(+)
MNVSVPDLSEWIEQLASPSLNSRSLDSSHEFHGAPTEVQDTIPSMRESLRPQEDCRSLVTPESKPRLPQPQLLGPNVHPYRLLMESRYDPRSLVDLIKAQELSTDYDLAQMGHEWSNPATAVARASASEIGRAVQQECRDRSRMPSSA